MAADNPMNTWAYGKAEPGWYCAAASHDPKMAEYLRAHGYEVRVQQLKPDEKVS